MNNECLELPWTGERYVPQIRGAVALEHLHRYAMATEFVKGKRVLDIASGEGYGSEMLAKVAASVVGVDIDEESAAHAQRKYGKKNLAFQQGSCEQIPLSDDSVDVVVSFETIEHLADHEKMLSEIKRVLMPDGLLIVSTPDKHEYTEVPEHHNQFHVKELYKNEFENLLGAYFKNQKILGQRITYGSNILNVEEPSNFGEIYEFNRLLAEGKKTKRLFQPLYLIAFCSDAKLPSINSTLCEQPLYETEAYQGISRQLAEKEEALKEQREVLLQTNQDLQKQENLLAERENLINRKNNLIREQEGLIGQQKEVILEKESQLQSKNQELAQKEALLKEQITLVLEHEKQIFNLNEILEEQKNIYNSFSWKYSVPLRKLEGLSKKIINRLRERYDAERNVGSRTAKFLATLLPFPKDKQVLLVFGHEATRTGAPIALLGIIKQLAQEQKFHISVILKRGGPLVSDYQNLCQTMVLGSASASNRKCLGWMAERLKYIQHQVICLSSTVDTQEAVAAFGEKGFSIISLIYEMPASINKWFGGAATMKIFDRYSQRLIFPSYLTYQQLHEEYEIDQKKTCIIPPGVAFGYLKTEIPSLRKKLCNELGLHDGVKIIVGCGSCDRRKGFDLFIQAGKKLIEDSIQKNRAVPIFLWVGTYLSCNYAVKHIAKIPENIRNYFIFLEERPSVEEIIGAADVFFLSSREDPFPLVALTAAGYGVPIVLFAGMTGVEGAFPERSYYSIPESNIDTACEVLTTALKRVNFDESSKLIRNEYSLSGYAAKIKLELDDSKKKYEVQAGNAIQQHQETQKSFLKKCIHLWNSKHYKRKPVPDFHPGIYKEDYMDPKDKKAPFKHYLKAGKPQGRWNLSLLPVKQYPISPDLRIGLHLHIFYEDLFMELMRRLEVNKVRPDLLITIAATIQDTTAIMEKLKSYPEKVEIRIVKNRGRDIGAFLTEFGPMLIERYDIIGHLHTKKTVHIEKSTATRWREFLLENLLGGRLPMADIILGAMSENENMGLVFPSDPNLSDWDKNSLMGKKLLLQLGIDRFYEQFNFPIGNMFWARTLALKSLLDLNLRYEDYPEEPIPGDGTILHALERVTAFVVEKEGYQIKMTHIKGITR